MPQFDDDTVAEQMVRGHVAADIAHAKSILAEMNERRRRADMKLFYSGDAADAVRYVLSDSLMDEGCYNGSAVRVASVPSGFVDKLRRQPQETWRGRRFATGRIMEFVSKDGEDARLVACVRNFPYEGKGGLFLSPYSAEIVHRKGRGTFDEQHGLYRIEYEPVAGDYVLGMFTRWGSHPINDQASLLLYIPRDRVLEIKGSVTALDTL